MTRDEAIEILADTLARELPTAAFATADAQEIQHQSRHLAERLVDDLLHPGYGSAVIEDTADAR